MKFFLLISIIAGAVFLYSSINQKNSFRDTNLSEESSAIWMTQLSEARAMAKNEGKPILMDFTGSNWCGWCVKLKKEVFTKPSFLGFANDNLILMTVDFPRGVHQEEWLVDQNNKLLDQYGVNSFPTIILTDYNGNLLGRTGYKSGGSENYVEHLKGLLSNSDN
tara:strand:- start:152 stop:643 length:492 start_codon:yes stop_codon:yes gene_type:complete